LADLVDKDYEARIGQVRAAWAAFEARCMEKQESVEAEALRLWQQAPDAARAMLTRHCSDLAAEACAAADRLREAIASPAKSQTN
jgi:dipeptidase